MSDRYYQQRAAGRTRRLVIAGAGLAVVACVTAAVVALLYDGCTRSFDRTPKAAIEAFLDAVEGGNLPQAQDCWQRDAYHDLAAGCSEICLARVAGARFEVMEVALGQPEVTPQGRGRMVATLAVSCSQGGQEHTAELVLDSIGADRPWRHWTIISSTFGGTVAQPWCK